MIYEIPKPKGKQKQPEELTYDTLKKVLDYFNQNPGITFYPAPEPLYSIFNLGYHGSEKIFLVRLDEMEDRKDFQGEIPGWCVDDSDYHLFRGPDQCDTMYRLNLGNDVINVWVIAEFDIFLYSLSAHLDSELPMDANFFKETRKLINHLLQEGELNSNWHDKGFGGNDDPLDGDPFKSMIAAYYKTIMGWGK